MALELKQTVKLSQQLVMTPQLQQAIKLLQLNQLELLSEVQQELMENPVLEEIADDDAPVDAPEERPESETPVDAAPAEPDAEAPEPTAEEMLADVDWENYFESRPQTSINQADIDRPAPEDNASRTTSLTEHLYWQLGFSDLTGVDREIATLIVGNLNENGYLQESLEGIAEAAGSTPERVEDVLLRVQEFDPVGVAARDLSECLRVQARVAGVTDPLVLTIINERMDLLQRRDLRGISKALGVTIEEVSIASDVIGSFEPRPGRQYSSEDPIYITPDIYVHKVGDEYHVVLNDDGMPRLKVSSAYRDVLARGSSEGKETREYVRERLRSAVWMIKSINQRQRTIVKVMESIIRFQREFFDRGSHALRPLNLRDVAEDIGMHESTVSRVTTNKYVQTPHGIFELKFFFNSSIQTTDGDAIASESVKEKIREIIAKEDARKPLSDQRIAQLLAEQQNVKIARRTVTKYRESMGILSSTTRKRFS